MTANPATADPATIAQDDPAGAAAALATRIDAATQRLLQTAAGITDEQAREASLLPGWSRGHVLTHLARNADSLRNLLIWARTGVMTPQYPSLTAREEEIASGADRPAAQLRADLEQSAAEFAAEIETVPESHWSAEVAGMSGPGHPAWYTLWRRLSEVEIHHVDLDAGYGPARLAGGVRHAEPAPGSRAFAGPGCPAALLHGTDPAAEYRIGPAGPSQPRRSADRPGPCWPG